MNRRRFNALVLASLATPFAASRAAAMSFAEYTPDAFVKLLGSGDPVIVHVHADWCSVCRAQMPVMERVLSGAAYKGVRAVRVNFDREKRFLADYKVIRQSTIIIFRGGKEIARLSYESDPERIEQTLAHAIS
jgi:thioredoxin 1